jgi:hypothetical protein
VSIERTCSWADINDSTFRNWVGDGFVTPPGPDGCGEAAVVETYVFSKLRRAIGFERARSSWYQARTSGADLLKVRDFGLLICGENAPVGVLALNPVDVASSIPDSEPVRVVNLVPWIRTVSGWYQAELRQNWGAGGASAAADSGQRGAQRQGRNATAAQGGSDDPNRGAHS